ncbi:hypothetical protein J6590_095692 [Homalodisca vitripennis]|nr:hypothetical protein J6590_095692 [Homalodisca vitripennis]
MNNVQSVVLQNGMSEHFSTASPSLLLPHHLSLKTSLTTVLHQRLDDQLKCSITSNATAYHLSLTNSVTAVLHKLFTVQCHDQLHPDWRDDQLWHHYPCCLPQPDNLSTAVPSIHDSIMCNQLCSDGVSDPIYYGLTVCCYITSA